MSTAFDPELKYALRSNYLKATSENSVDGEENKGTLYRALRFGNRVHVFIFDTICKTPMYSYGADVFELGDAELDTYVTGAAQL